MCIQTMRNKMLAQKSANTSNPKSHFQPLSVTWLMAFTLIAVTDFESFVTGLCLLRSVLC